jgi:hypothetical protein
MRQASRVRQLGASCAVTGVPISSDEYATPFGFTAIITLRYGPHAPFMWSSITFTAISVPDDDRSASTCGQPRREHVVSLVFRNRTAASVPDIVPPNPYRPWFGVEMRRSAVRQSLLRTVGLELPPVPVVSVSLDGAARFRCVGANRG